MSRNFLISLRRIFTKNVTELKCYSRVRIISTSPRGEKISKKEEIIAFRILSRQGKRSLSRTSLFRATSGRRHRRRASPRVKNFRQKINSAEDGIDGTNGYFRRNSGCSAEQKTAEFRSEPFRGRENKSEFRSVEQK